MDNTLDLVAMGLFPSLMTVAMRLLSFWNNLNVPTMLECMCCPRVYVPSPDENSSVVPRRSPGITFCCGSFVIRIRCF